MNPCPRQALGAMRHKMPRAHRHAVLLALLCAAFARGAASAAAWEVRVLVALTHHLLTCRALF